MKHYFGRIEFSEKENKPTVRIELLRTGRFIHSDAPNGVLPITPELLETLKLNFENGSFLPPEEGLPMDINHTDKNFNISKGWMKDLEIKPSSVKGEMALYANVEPTPAMIQPLKDKEIKYVSASLDFNFLDKQTGLRKPVLRGAAWTNVPYIRGMAPAEIINFADLINLDDSADDGGPDDAADGVEDPTNSSPHSGLPALGQAHDPDAKSDVLPDQCRSCKLLFLGSCPFPDPALKVAAAGDGNCPRYESYDSVSNTTDEQEHNMSGQNAGGAGAGGGANLNDQTNNDAILQLSDKVKEQSDELAKQQAIVVQLSENLEKERNYRIELSTGARKATDARTVQRLIEEGRIFPSQVKDLEKMLNKARGNTGIIQLSDMADHAEIDLGETTLEQDIINFCDSLEPQVTIENGREEGVHTVNLSNRFGVTQDLTPMIEARHKELCTQNGGDRSGLYGQAAREIAAEVKR